MKIKLLNLLNNSLKISELDAQNYDGIYLTGGHVVMFDFPDNKDLSMLIAQFYESGKIISAVCHGPSGLLNVSLRDNNYLIKDKKITGFSWREEGLGKRKNSLPFNIEKEIKKRGGKYSTAILPFNSYVIEDGLLITGQNPKSAKGVGRKVVKKTGKTRKTKTIESTNYCDLWSNY